MAMLENLVFRRMILHFERLLNIQIISLKDILSKTWIYDGIFDGNHLGI